MKLIINNENHNLVFSCIKVQQSKFAEKIRALEIELNNPLAFTEANKAAKLAPYNHLSDLMHETELMLMKLYHKNGKDWHKSTFGHSEDKKARLEALAKIIEAMKAFDLKFDINKVDFQVLKTAFIEHIKFDMRKLEYRSTVEENITICTTHMANLEHLNSRIVIGTILEETELNFINFKA